METWPRSSGILAFSTVSFSKSSWGFMYNCTSELEFLGSQPCNVSIFFVQRPALVGGYGLRLVLSRLCGDLASGLSPAPAAQPSAVVFLPSHSSVPF